MARKFWGMLCCGLIKMPHELKLKSWGKVVRQELLLVVSYLFIFIQLQPPFSTHTSPRWTVPSVVGSAGVGSCEGGQGGAARPVTSPAPGLTASRPGTQLLAETVTSEVSSGVAHHHPGHLRPSCPSLHHVITFTPRPHLYRDNLMS